MTRRSPAVTAFILPTHALLLLTTSFLATSVQAQEPLPQGQGAPNEEPSSTATLMERTDLGNVAQAARMHYHKGVRDLAQAKKMREKAAQISEPEKKARIEKKAQGALEGADKSFREALSYNAGFLKAYAGLGSALRMQGRTEEALQVHAVALRRAPDDLENFQGWAESLLALNMVGNATTDYSGYLQTNPDRAEILMTQIKKWLADKETDPGEINPADVQRLADWVAQQNRG